jgi:NAD(P)-dependent dehydrogenase (short-subunit alcohol dehydrogenase family)
MPKTILITGAGSGFGEGTALGLARQGHDVIAGVQISPQVTELRLRATRDGLPNLRVEKLDLLDEFDVARAQTWDVDILLNNAGIGEGGPVAEIPLTLMRSNFETNVFAPLALTQGFIRKWVAAKKEAKIVFTSSVVGLMTPEGVGTYSATKHAIEAVAESLAQELQPYRIKVQTINPAAYFTGFNERLAETPFRWLDDSWNFTKRAALGDLYYQLFDTDSMRLDPAQMVEAMVGIVPAKEGKFRNVVPAAAEEMLKQHQQQAWGAVI